MSQLHIFPDTLMFELSELEPDLRGYYLQLLMLCHARGGALKDDRIIARMLGVHPNKCHKILDSLCTSGFVIQDKTTYEYTVIHLQEKSTHRGVTLKNRGGNTPLDTTPVTGGDTPIVTTPVTPLDTPPVVPDISLIKQQARPLSNPNPNPNTNPIERETRARKEVFLLSEVPSCAADELPDLWEQWVLTEVDRAAMASIWEDFWGKYLHTENKQSPPEWFETWKRWVRRELRGKLTNQTEARA